LNGKRIGYTNPIKLLLIWLGVTTLVMFAAVDFDEIMAKNIDRQLQSQKSMPKLSPEKEEVVQKSKEAAIEAASFLTHNQQLLYSFLIPFTALLLSIFFRKQGYYFSEHLVMTTYSYVGYHILNSVILLLYFIKSMDLYIIPAISFIFTIGFMTYFATKFYGQKENKWKVGIKVTIVHVITFVVYGLLVGILGLGYAYAKVVLMK
jgi:hypothetical protein